MLTHRQSSVICQTRFGLDILAYHLTFFHQPTIAEEARGESGEGWLDQEAEARGGGLYRGQGLGQQNGAGEVTKNEAVFPWRSKWVHCFLWKRGVNHLSLAEIRPQEAHD